MPHIHTKPNQHDASATAFIIRDDFDEPKMLLITHKKFGTLMPPGGHVELDETPWAALAHELYEEAGYELKDLEILQPKTRLKTVSQVVIHPQPMLSNTHYIPDGHYHTDLDYLLLAHAAPTKLPDDGESQDLRWLTHAEIQALGDEHIMPNIREMSEYVFSTLLDAPEFEWVRAENFRTDKISG